MIKFNFAKHKPFKTVEIPLKYDIKEKHIFNELFTTKNLIDISIFSNFDKDLARFIYPDSDNVFVYLNKQSKAKKGTQIINIYLFNKEAIESVINTDEGKDIVLNSTYRFSDEELGKNKGTLILTNDGKKHIFQNNREKNEFTSALLKEYIIIENVSFIHIGDEVFLNIPSLEYHSTSDYIKKIKTENKVINLFTSESSLSYLIEQNNINKKTKDNKKDYKSIPFIDISTQGETSQYHYFINKDKEYFKVGVRYPIIIEYKYNAWIVKKDIQIGSLKSEVLFLFRDEKDILDIPEYN